MTKTPRGMFLACVMFSSLCGRIAWAEENQRDVSTPEVAGQRTDEPPGTSQPKKLKKDELGETRNVHTFGLTMLCGQPSPEEFAQAKERGVQRVISLRQDGEVDWDEKSAVTKLGIEFYDFGFRSPESLSDELLDKARKVLSEKDSKPVMMHCGSANRVGAVWAAHRALDGGLSVEEALKEAKQVGLRSTELEKRVIEYINKRKAEEKKRAAESKSERP